MMEHLKNIDIAFKHIRLFTAVLIVGCCCLCGYTIHYCLGLIEKAQQRIYVIAGSKAMEAFSSDRKDNIPVEAKDHVRSFHEYFFSISPDEKAIQSNIRKALYLADESAKTQYDALKEKNYYTNVISGNVNQQVRCDSVLLQLDSYPYYFRYYGVQTIIRTSAIITRSLVTEGYLRNTERTDNNAHGFLITRWVTLENKDLTVSKR